MFSVDVSGYQDTDTRKKNDDVLAHCSFTNAEFSIEILMGETELVVTQN